MFDWALAISVNREALLRILAELFALAGESGAATLPRHAYHAILIVLRPAESAVRRLIVIAARGLVLQVRRASCAPSAPISRGEGNAARIPEFVLKDTLRFFGHARHQFTPGPGPRLSLFGFCNPLFAPKRPAPPPFEDGMIGAEHLRHRLLALKSALDDLPRQARRLARWRARRDFALKYGAANQPKRLSTLRPGRAPGSRKREVHEIDAVLKECHGLAYDASAMPNTS